MRSGSRGAGLTGRAYHQIARSHAKAACSAILRVAGGVFVRARDPPGEDPQMAAGADEETSETSAGGGRTPLTMVIPAPC
jgi:hypothetical protein